MKENKRTKHAMQGNKDIRVSFATLERARGITLRSTELIANLTLPYPLRS